MAIIQSFTLSSQAYKVAGSPNSFWKTTSPVYQGNILAANPGVGDLISAYADNGVITANLAPLASDNISIFLGKQDQGDFDGPFQLHNDNVLLGGTGLLQQIPVRDEGLPFNARMVVMVPGDDTQPISGVAQIEAYAVDYDRNNPADTSWEVATDEPALMSLLERMKQYTNLAGWNYTPGSVNANIYDTNSGVFGKGGSVFISTVALSGARLVCPAF